MPSISHGPFPYHKTVIAPVLLFRRFRKSSVKYGGNAESPEPSKPFGNPPSSSSGRAVFARAEAQHRNGKGPVRAAKNKLRLTDFARKAPTRNVKSLNYIGDAPSIDAKTVTLCSFRGGCRKKCFLSIYLFFCRDERGERKRRGRVCLRAGFAESFDNFKRLHGEMNSW